MAANADARCERAQTGRLVRALERTGADVYPGWPWWSMGKGLRRIKAGDVNRAEPAIGWQGRFGHLSASRPGEVSAVGIIIALLSTAACKPAVVTPAVPDRCLATPDSAACECPRHPSGGDGLELCRKVRDALASARGSALTLEDTYKECRWLALPVAHPSSVMETLDDLTARERRELATTTVNEARKHFPEGDWAIAVNPRNGRSQCHLHVHIGRLLPDKPDRSPESYVVANAEDMFERPNHAGYRDDGLWAVPVTGGFRVHVAHPKEAAEEHLKIGGPCPGH